MSDPVKRKVKEIEFKRIQPKELVAYCSSRFCCPDQSLARGKEKVVSIHATFCPDCKSTLTWLPRSFKRAYSRRVTRKSDRSVRQKVC